TFEPPLPLFGEYIYKNFILERLHELFHYRDKKFDALFTKQSTT
ncbi:MAG: hypothetical protein ACI9JN_002919, partial [Bacteroidia bacterium]